MIDLKTATPEEIAEALIAFDMERPGLAYDVGMALHAKNVSKEFPGPRWSWYPQEHPTYRLWVTEIDHTQKINALFGMRQVLHVELLTEIPAILNTLKRGERFEVVRPKPREPNSGNRTGESEATDFEWTQQSAQETVEALAKWGVTAVFGAEGGEQTPTSHIRSMGELGYPAMAS